MKVAFKKMDGAGNDFVVIDNLDGAVVLAADAIARICDRHRGVGADGLILIESRAGHDFFMRFFNADGGEAEMCGNGARCSAAFAVEAGLGRRGPEGVEVEFQTGSGIVGAMVKPDDARWPSRFEVEIRLMDAREMRLDIPVQVAQMAQYIHFMIVGTRHAIVPVKEAPALTHSEIEELGRYVRYHESMGSQGANVNFASLDEDGRIHIRTYEKGVEAETHACGTGSVAAAVVFAHLGRCQSPVTVVQRGGDALQARFELCAEGARRVFLEGPAEVNFEGTFAI